MLRHFYPSSASKISPDLISQFLNVKYFIHSKLLRIAPSTWRWTRPTSSTSCSSKVILCSFQWECSVYSTLGGVAFELELEKILGPIWVNNYARAACNHCFPCSNSCLFRSQNINFNTHFNSTLIITKFDIQPWSEIINWRFKMHFWDRLTRSFFTILNYIFQYLQIVPFTKRARSIRKSRDTIVHLGRYVFRRAAR